MSECPVKLDSDEACLIAADWHEEQGDSVRADRMRAVLTFTFGDRVSAKGRGGTRPLVVVGRDEQCLSVMLMRDDKVNSGTRVEALPPGELKRRRALRLPEGPTSWERHVPGLREHNREALSYRVGEQVQYKRGQTEYRAWVVGHSAHTGGRRGVRILPLPGQGQEFSIRSASPACLSRVEGAGEVANLVLAPTFPLRHP